MKTKICPIKYMHDFEDYPCKMCHPELNYSWGKILLISALGVAVMFGLMYLTFYIALL